MRGTFALIFLFLVMSCPVWGKESRFCSDYKKALVSCEAGSKLPCPAELKKAQVQNTPCDQNHPQFLWGAMDPMRSPIMSAYKAIHECSGNFFSVILDAGRVEECSSIKYADVYNKICSAKCNLGTGSKKDSRLAKEQLVSDAQEVLEKVYKNHLSKSIDLLSALPLEGNIYDNIPKTCLKGSPGLGKELKKSVAQTAQATLNSHISRTLKAHQKEKTEQCFPPGLVRNYFKLEKGKFSYEVGEYHGKINFDSYSKVDKLFSRYMDRCYKQGKKNSYECSEKKKARNRGRIKKQTDQVKKEIANQCELIQKKIFDLSKPENLGLAFNPHLINIRKEFPNIEFLKKKEKSSSRGFIASCQEQFKEGVEPNAKLNKKCSAIRQVMCAKGKNKTRPVLDAVLDKKSLKSFKPLYDSVMGTKKFVASTDEIEKSLCGKIKEQWKDSGSDLDLMKYSIKLLKGDIEALDENGNPIKMSALLLKNLDLQRNFNQDPKELEKFLKEFSQFSALPKQSYLTYRKESLIKDAICYFGRNSGARALLKLGGLDTYNSSCQKNNEKKIDDIAVNTKEKIQKTLKSLADRGHTGFDASMSGRNVVAELDDFKEEQDSASTPSRSIASVQESPEVNNQAGVGVANSAVSSLEIPLSQKIQSDINQKSKNLVEAKDMLKQAEKSITEFNQNNVRDTEEKENYYQDLLNQQKESQEIIKSLQDEIAELKKEKRKAAQEEGSSRFKEERAVAQQSLSAKGSSIEEAQTIPIQKAATAATSRGFDSSFYNNLIVSFKNSSKPDFELIFPVSNEEYKRISNAENFKVASKVDLSNFDPLDIQYKSLTEVEKDLGEGSVFFDKDQGHYFIKVSDRKGKEEVIYQLRTKQELSSGPITVTGVYVPVTSGKQIKKSFERVEKNEKKKSVNPGFFKRYSLGADTVKKTKIKLYKSLVNYLKDVNRSKEARDKK